MQPASVAAPVVEFAQKSDPGRDPEKQVNEDACAYRETRFGHLSVVCDGMGGHAGGREASNLALQTILEYFDAAPAGSRPADVLKGALSEANRRVFAMANVQIGGRPGSTVVASLMHGDGTEIAHVGDSRCYLVHQGQIFQITKDHSMVQQLVDAGLLTPAQAAVHPNANQITRALGMSAEVDVDLRREAVTHVVGDAFVLCSDGLSDLVEPAEILQIVGSAPAAQAVGQLVDLANARGGHDNVTVSILRARESATKTLGPLPPTVVGDTMHDNPSARVTQPAFAAAPPSDGPTSARMVAPTAPGVVQAVVVPPAPRPLEDAGAARRRARRRWFIVSGLCAMLAISGIVLVVFVFATQTSGRGPRSLATDSPSESPRASGDAGRPRAPTAP